VKEKVLSLQEMVAKFTASPAKILGVSKGTLNQGADADITIMDLSLKKKVDVTQFKSKSRNSPFHGWELEGEAVCTLVNGEIVKNIKKTVKPS